jgi:hypothetical protein
MSGDSKEKTRAKIYNEERESKENAHHHSHRNRTRA